MRLLHLCGSCGDCPYVPILFCTLSFVFVGWAFLLSVFFFSLPGLPLRRLSLRFSLSLSPARILSLSFLAVSSRGCPPLILFLLFFVLGRPFCARSLRASSLLRPSRACLCLPGLLPVQLSPCFSFASSTVFLWVPYFSHRQFFFFVFLVGSPAVVVSRFRSFFAPSSHCALFPLLGTGRPYSVVHVFVFFMGSAAFCFFRGYAIFASPCPGGVPQCFF